MQSAAALIKRLACGLDLLAIHPPSLQAAGATKVSAFKTRSLSGGERRL
jgi:hypothetical protein